MATTERKSIGYDDTQIRDARRLCGILQNVPVPRRNMFVALANAYMDGMAAGEAIAAAEVSKSKALG